jgi:hypothetical protein
MVLLVGHKLTGEQSRGYLSEGCGGGSSWLVKNRCRSEAIREAAGMSMNGPGNAVGRQLASSRVKGAASRPGTFDRDRGIATDNRIETERAYA